MHSTLCSAEITFKTDPKNTDYAAEHGASRNFEPWREEKTVEEEDRLARLEEEENNPMKALENRTVDSKREMDVLDALQDIRARNARNERMAHRDEDLVARITAEEPETEEDRQRRLEDEEDERLEEQLRDLDVRDERHSKVDSHATSAVSLACVARRSAVMILRRQVDIHVDEVVRQMLCQ